MVIDGHHCKTNESHAALVNMMATSIAERTHCEHPMRPASDGRISHGCKIPCGRDLSPRDKFVGTVKAVLHDQGRRNGVRRRHGRSWHAPPLQRAYHRRSQSLVRVVNFLLTLSVTKGYVRDQRQRAQRTKRCETSAHALLYRGGNNGPVYPSAKT